MQILPKDPRRRLFFQHRQQRFAQLARVVSKQPARGESPRRAERRGAVARPQRRRAKFRYRPRVVSIMMRARIDWITPKSQIR